MCKKTGVYLATVLVVSFGLLPSAFAQSNASGQSDDEPQIETEPFEPIGPTSAYDEPTKQFLSIHGYATGLFAASFDDFEPTGEMRQAFLPAMKGDSQFGFGFDGAFSPGLAIPEGAARLQIQFVQGKPTMMQLYGRWHITESLDSPPDGFSMRLTAGRYWWPFGNHNTEWFSIKNEFNVQSPVTTLVAPPHHAPVGAKLDGVAALSESFGFNYTLSVSSGPRYLTSPGSKSARNTKPKVNGVDRPALTGRVVGVFKDMFRLGFSASNSRLRHESKPNLNQNDPRRYPATHTTYGPHFRVGFDEFSARANYYRSVESLEDDENGTSPAESNLEQSGGTLDVSYGLPFEIPAIGQPIPKARAAFASIERASDESRQFYQLGGGINFRPAEAVLLKTEYVLQLEEGDIEQTPNNYFSSSISVQY